MDGYLRVSPGASELDLEARFVRGSRINGANLRRACIDQTWEQQLEIFSNILLTNLFAIYESWIASVLHTLGHSNQSLEKGLQFPTVTRGGKVSGARRVIALLTATESIAIKNNFYGKLKRNSKYSEPVLDNLLLCYRYFKEVRNCLIHRGGMADQKTEDAYTCFAAVANTAALGLSEVPAHVPIVNGNRVALILRGVVGFSDVVNRLILTLDTELSRSTSAEKELTLRWKEKFGKKRYMLATDPKRRKKKIARMLDILEFPRLGTVDESAEAMLMRTHLIF